MYTTQLVQERGAAAQHICRHGDDGFRCLHRRFDRDLLNRYTVAAAAAAADGGGDRDGDVARCMLSKVETEYAVFSQRTSARTGRDLHFLSVSDY